MSDDEADDAAEPAGPEIAPEGHRGLSYFPSSCSISNSVQSLQYVHLLYCPFLCVQLVSDRLAPAHVEKRTMLSWQPSHTLDEPEINAQRPLSCEWKANRNLGNAIKDLKVVHFLFHGFTFLSFLFLRAVCLLLCCVRGTSIRARICNL